MTSQNIHSRPTVLLNDKTIVNLKSASYDNPGNNQLSSLTCVVSDPEFFNYRLFNKEVKFFVNEGGSESIPVFTGYIRDITPSEKEVTFIAYDCRTFISGRESQPIVITNNDNYDGYTVVQFITDIIKNNSLNISLDSLSDTTPPVLMNGVRSTTNSAYDILKERIESITDNSDPRNPLNYIIDVIDNDLIITKKRASGGTGIRFSKNDGIINISIRRRAPITKATVYGNNNSSGTFQYGNSPSGNIGTTYTDDNANTNAECTERAISIVMAERNEVDEITINASKGYDLGLNNIIYLDVDDSDVRGEHRIASKKINFSGTGLNYTIGLDKLGPRVSDYTF